MAVTSRCSPWRTAVHVRLRNGGKGSPCSGFGFGFVPYPSGFGFVPYPFRVRGLPVPGGGSVSVPGVGFRPGSRPLPVRFTPRFTERIRGGRHSKVFTLRVRSRLSGRERRPWPPCVQTVHSGAGRGARDWAGRASGRASGRGAERGTGRASGRGAERGTGRASGRGAERATGCGGMQRTRRRDAADAPLYDTVRACLVRARGRLAVSHREGLTGSRSLTPSQAETGRRHPSTTSIHRF
jgi:hypothetical protein